jgi:hypothetical protein
VYFWNASAQAYSTRHSLGQIFTLEWDCRIVFIHIQATEIFFTSEGVCAWVFGWGVNRVKTFWNYPGHITIQEVRCLFLVRGVWVQYWVEFFGLLTRPLLFHVYLSLGPAMIGPFAAALPRHSESSDYKNYHFYYKFPGSGMPVPSIIHILYSTRLLCCLTDLKPVSLGFQCILRKKGAA